MAGRSPASSASTTALTTLAVIAGLFFLRSASTLIIPIALSVLIYFAVVPPVAWLERHRVPRIAGAPVVLLALVAALASGAYALRHDVGRVARAVPEAAERARELVRTHVGEASTGSSEPQPVGTSGTPSAPGGLMQRVISSIVGLAGHLVVIFFLVLFLLIFGQQARKRIIEISGDDADERRVTATIFDDIHAQIQRFLLVLLFTATVVALATWGVLAAMKVEHAAMWALLAGIFNSIPYFGPVIVSGGLFIVGLVQGGDVTQAVWMAGAALVITSLEGWLLTPPLMGKAERMSALAVFLGLLLFTWLWGPWGTVLAVPMLVVIKSVADHVDRLKPLGRLMAP